MKKYIKPMMESEAFVSNEYVSACYVVKCSNSDQSCGELHIKNLATEGLNLSSDNTFGTFVGKIGNTDPGCRHEDAFEYKDYGFD